MHALHFLHQFWHQSLAALPLHAQQLDHCVDVLIPPPRAVNHNPLVGEGGAQHVQICDGMAGLKGRDDTLQLTQQLESLQMGKRAVQPCGSALKGQVQAGWEERFKTAPLLNNAVVVERLCGPALRGKGRDKVPAR